MIGGTGVPPVLGVGVWCALRTISGSSLARFRRPYPEGHLLCKISGDAVQITAFLDGAGIAPSFT